MKNSYREKQNAKGIYEIRGVFAPRQQHPELKKQIKALLRGDYEQVNRLAGSHLDSGTAEQL
jgi:hypothetical protein